MVNETLMAEISIYIPAGERSDFVNEAIEEALADYKQEKAFEEMDKLRKEANLYLSTEEIIRLKNDGRP